MNTQYALVENIVREQLAKMLSEKENTGSEYDTLIMKTLKVDKVPTPAGTYVLGKDGTVAAEDKDAFTKLYKVAPSKQGKEESEVGSKGSGHGEVAMYWLLSKQYTVEDSRGKGKPDLTVNGVGVEVKSYDDTKMTLGRVGSDKNSLEVLSTLFGLETLVSSLEKGSEKKRHASALTFNKKEIVDAFTTLRDFSANDELRNLASKYPLISNIYSRVDNVLGAFDLDKTFKPEDAAGALMKQLLNTKLGTKPGMGGYIVNVSMEGKMDYTQVTEGKVKGLDNTTLLDNINMNQGQLIIDTTILK
jgi:hypothetical protein